MKTYLLSVLTASVFSVIITVMSPEMGNIKRFVSFIGALSVALCILSPIASGDVTFPDYSDVIPQSRTEKSEMKAEYTARNAVRVLSAQTGIAENEITVSVKTDGENVTEITLTAECVPRVRETENDLEEIFGCNVEIISER